MKGSVNDLFFLTLRKAVKLTNEELSLPPDADLRALYALSDKHDLAHLSGYALGDLTELADARAAKAFENKINAALFRHLQREAAAEELRRALNGARIPFIMLKGMVVACMYPEAWMRTSSDIDVLIKPEDADRAFAALADAGMKKSGVSAHDVSFYSSAGFHVELHHTLIEEDRFPRVSAVLARVWDLSYPAKDGSGEYLMRDEMFYFYHVAHMVKHFERGGCGVRSLLDLYILDRSLPPDPARDAMLSEGGILLFAEKMRALSRIWFANEPSDGELDGIASFILEAGTYGSNRNNIAIRKKKSGNKFKYYLERVFLPYRYMKVTHPSLVKAPFLLPFFWVKRWFKFLDPKVRGKVRREIAVENTANGAELERVTSVMKELGIW